MSASVGVLELDSGDAPSFTVTVDPYDDDTNMTGELTSPTAAVLPFSMAFSGTRGVWTGTGPVLTLPGEYLATFVTTGTGAGVKYHTVIVQQPPPLTSALRRIRLLIADTDPAYRLFRVDELQDFLDMEGGSYKLAAATALEVVARSEALKSKVIRSQDLSTDGAKLAAELRASAAELRRQVDAGEGAEDGGGFEVADFTDPRALPYRGWL